jgi:pimeloyl-ACP methyl ester carboxylesterase
MTSKDLAYSPCIIYCHGNAGNKIDIIEILDFLLWDFNICSFDFSGAGHSEGDYVTLGYYEKDDIKAIVEFLRNELHIQKIILYGRSMGAVSSLRYAEMDPNIKAIVLDSPFSDFPKLCEEILSNKFFMPKIISSVLISMARDRIKDKVTNFDIYDFTPYKNAKKVQVPTIILHGTQDSLVKYEHSQTIYNNLPKNTYKKLLLSQGEHNDCRSSNDVMLIREFIMQFAYDALILKEHYRRLSIKNARINFHNKHGLNINSVLLNFKNNVKNSIKEETKERRLNNFNVIRNNKFQDDISEGDKISVKYFFEKIRSKSTDTIEEEVMLSKIKKNENKTNPKGKTFKREHSNNKDNYNSNNIRMIKLNDFGQNANNLQQEYQDLKKNKTENNKIDKHPFSCESSQPRNEKISNNSQISINENKIKSPLIETPVNLNSENNITFTIDLNKTFINTPEINLNTRNCQTLGNNLNESQILIDNIGVRKSNLSFNINPSKTRLRSDRNNILGGLLGCDLKIKSDQIKITNLDKSIRKRSSATDNSLNTTNISDISYLDYKNN